MTKKTSDPPRALALRGRRWLLRRLSIAETGRLIEALTGEDRVMAWRQVDEQACDQVLELLPDSLREELLGARPLPSVRNMLNAFVLKDGRLVQVPVDTRADFDRLQPIWVDLVAPTAGLRSWVGGHFGIGLPDPDELTDIEASARFFIMTGATSTCIRIFCSMPMTLRETSRLP